MALREGAGQFLRVLAAGASPQVAQQQAQEDMALQAREGNRKDMMIKMLAESAQLTQDPNERSEIAQALQRLGAGDLTTGNQPPQELEELGGGPGQPQPLIGAQSDTKLARFAGRLGDSDVIGFSDEAGNTYVRQGQKLIKNPEGLTILRTGRTGEDIASMTKKTQGSLEQDILNADKASSRLDAIKEAFRPEFTEVGTKIAAGWNALQEKLGINLNKASKKDLADYSAFGRKSIANLNLYIKEITGAQMSEKEATRLRRAMPDLGDGLFDGDSATQFKSKMDDIIVELDAARDRALFLRANGLDDNIESNSLQYPMDDFRNVPQMPQDQNFKDEDWHKMPPSDRKELVKLLNARNLR